MSIRTFHFDTPASCEIVCGQLSLEHSRAVSAHQHEISIWSLGSPTALLTLAAPDARAVCFSMQEDLVCSGHSSGGVTVWNVAKAKALCTLTSHRAPCTALAAHPTRPLLASGAADCTIKVWDLRKRYCAHTFRSHEAPVTAVHFSADGKCLASGCEDGRVIVWDCAALKKLLELRSASAAVTSLELGTHLAVGHADGALRSWNLTSKAHSSVSESLPVQRVCLLQDLVLAGVAGGLHVWETQKGLMRDAVTTRWRAVADLAVGEVSASSVVAALTYEGNSLDAHVLNTTALKGVGDTAPRRQRFLSDLTEEHGAVVVLLTQRAKVIDELAALWASGRVLETLQAAEALKDHSVLPAILEAGLWSGTVVLPMESCMVALRLCLRLLETKYEASMRAAIRTVTVLLPQQFSTLAETLGVFTLHRVSPQRKAQIQQCEACALAFAQFRAALAASCSRGGALGDAARTLGLELDRLATKCKPI